jgi:hypothetical protein
MSLLLLTWSCPPTFPNTEIAVMVARIEKLERVAMAMREAIVLKEEWSAWQQKQRGQSVL